MTPETLLIIILGISSTIMLISFIADNRYRNRVAEEGF